MRFQKLVPLALLMFPLAFAGCSVSTSTPGETILVYARAGESNRLDPIHDDSGESATVMTNLFDTLIDYAEGSADLVPSLALAWTPSDDGLTWTFKLREGVTFHDGTPFNAEAVVFSINRMIQDDPNDPDPKPYAPNYEVIERVEATGPHEVTFRLKEPSAVFLRNLAMFPAGIVSPTAVKKHGNEFKRNPVGTGPFRFEYWKHDEELVLSAFEDHWRGAPKVDKVVFTVTQEPAARIARIRRGEAHIADNLPSIDLHAAAEDPGVAMQSIPGMNVGYLGMNTEKPALADPQVRKALWRAIDKNQILNLCYGDTAQRAANPMPPALLGYNKDIEEREPVERAHDPAEARRMLEAAGVELPLKLRLFVMASARPYMPEPLKVAQLVKQQLSAAGVDVEIVQNEVSMHFQECSAGRHDLCLLGWNTDNADPDNFLHQLLSPDNINSIGGTNNTRYNNPEVQRLLIAGKRELDDEKRAEIYWQAQELIYNDAPMIPLAHTPVECAQSPRLKGYKLHPTILVRLNEAELTDK
jgi:ABC-type transport system substrate-binding protein